MAEADRGRRPKGKGGVSQHQAHAPVFSVRGKAAKAVSGQMDEYSRPVHLKCVCFVSIELRAEETVLFFHRW